MSSINEFKLVGAGYIAKNGNSANAGTDPLAPKASPADAGMPSGNIVLGSGYYLTSSIQQGGRNYFGDHMPIIDFNFASFANSGVRFTDCFLKNITTMGVTSDNSGIIDINRCILVDVNSILRISNGTLNVRLSAFFNLNGMILGGSNNYQTSRFIGSGLFNFSGFLVTVAFCFFNKQSSVQTFQSSGSNWFRLSNCMVNGLILNNSVSYECKRLFDGSPRLDADPLIPDIIDADPTFYSRGNYSGDPKFLDFFGGIVEPDSDLLKKSSGSNFVGGVKPGRITQVRNNTDPNTTITLLNVVEAGNGYMVAPGENWGKITVVTRESTSVVELGARSPIIPLNFDSDETPGTTLNNNVPDSFPLSDPGINPGKLPNRLTYLLRTSQRNQKPTQDSHWDNDAAAGGVAGTYYVQEWFTKPTLTQTLGTTYGNAEPEGYGGTVNAINARWTEYTIYLRNDRSY